MFEDVFRTAFFAQGSPFAVPGVVAANARDSCANGGKTCEYVIDRRYRDAVVVASTVPNLGVSYEDLP